MWPSSRARTNNRRHNNPAWVCSKSPGSKRPWPSRGPTENTRWPNSVDFIRSNRWTLSTPCCRSWVGPPRNTSGWRNTSHRWCRPSTGVGSVSARAWNSPPSITKQPRGRTPTTSPFCSPAATTPSTNKRAWNIQAYL